MTPEAQLLVLAPREVGGRIAAQAGEGRALAVADPYEALLEMGKRPWPVVLLAAPASEMAAVARATRRLQKQARIVALCGAADEQEIQPLAGDVLDDYLIDPPASRELAGLLHRVRAAGPAAAEALSGAELAGLIESAKDLASLEARVAELVSSRLGEPVLWTGAPAPAPAAELLVFDDPPRALVRTNLDASARAADSAGLTVSPNPAPGEGDAPSASAGQAAAPSSPQAPAASPPPASVAGPSASPAEASGPQPLLACLRQFLPALRAVARRTEVLRRLSITDDLTGLYNRRYFYQLAGEILLWSRRKDSRVTLLIYDIDNFKRYNDEFGHQAGDEILRETAVMMRQITRSHDIVARVGGDEFAVLFWEAEPPRSEGSQPLEKPYALADRFRRAVTSHRFPSLGPKAKGVLTISGGLSTFPRDGASVEELIRRADDALREAKQCGKNAIRIIGPG
jgi:diguanylate cyclase (GGDEF)-like protein